MVQDIDAQISFTILNMLVKLIIAIFLLLITGAVILSMDTDTAWDFLLDVIHILWM